MADGIREQEPVVESDFLPGADPAVEIVKIRAATEGNVLAIIDVLPAGKVVGGGAASQEWAAFEQANPETGVSQRDGRGRGHRRRR